MSKNTKGKQIFRYIKGNPHIAIDSTSVTTEHKVAFAYDGKGLNIVNISKASLTSSEEGFSQGGPSTTIDGKILKFNRIHSGSTLFEETENKVDEKETFNAAEEAIANVPEISIDDLLKDL